MGLRRYTLILSLILTFSSTAQSDFGQALPGQLDDGKSIYEDENYKISVEEQQYQNVFGATPQQYTDEELKDAQLSQKDKGWLKTTSEEGSILINPNPDGYMEYKNGDLIKESYQVSNNELSLSYLYDTFDYKDNQNIYKRTFENKDKDAHALQSGYLFFSYKGFIQRNIISSFYQVNVGASYNKGQAFFEGDTALSRTQFNLWVFPIDLNLGIKINFNRSISLSIQAGPTIVPVWQNRSDRDDEDNDKDVKQVGYGYNGVASLDFSIFNMYPNIGSKLRGSSDITNLSVSLVARTMGISGFKREDFEISGASFGLGFNFEYL